MTFALLRLPLCTRQGSAQMLLPAFGPGLAFFFWLTWVTPFPTFSPPRRRRIVHTVAWSLGPWSCFPTDSDLLKGRVWLLHLPSTNQLSRIMRLNPQNSAVFPWDTASPAAAGHGNRCFQTFRSSNALYSQLYPT